MNSKYLEIYENHGFDEQLIMENNNNFLVGAYSSWQQHSFPLRGKGFRVMEKFKTPWGKGALEDSLIEVLLFATIPYVTMCN